MMNALDMDKLRLDRLGAHDFELRYSIREDGSIKVTVPTDALCIDLRAAIDFARAWHKEIPFCPVCRSSAEGRKTVAVTEEHRGADGRFTCEVCKTTFEFK